MRLSLELDETISSNRLSHPIELDETISSNRLSHPIELDETVSSNQIVSDFINIPDPIKLYLIEDHREDNRIYFAGSEII